MKRLNRSFLLALFVACAVSGGVFEKSSSANGYLNDRWLNQGWLNQGWLNQGWLNQGWLNQGWLNGGDAGAGQMSGMTTWQGLPIDGVSISGNALSGWAWVWEFSMGWHQYWWGWGWGWDWGWNYRWLAPTEFNGAHFTMTVTDPDTSGTIASVEARITSVTKYGLEEESYYYTFEVYVATLTGTMTTWSWYPGCSVNNNGDALPAIALQGGWNYTQGTAFGGSKIDNSPDRVTFACMNGAIGKCGAEKGQQLPTGMGYMPWRWRNEFDAAGGVVPGSGETDHQTCTRLVTADYCGDGRPHTYTGRPIEQWDLLPQPVNTWGPNPNAQNPEAEWTPDGAVWVDCWRILQLPPNPEGQTPQEQMSCPTHNYTTCDLNGLCTPHQVTHNLVAQCLAQFVLPQGEPNHMLNLNDNNVWAPPTGTGLIQINWQ